ATASAGNEQVLLAVVVVIGPGGGNADAVAEADAGLLGYVCEGAVALVAVEGVFAQLVDEVNVVEAVAVEVTHGHTAAVVVQVHLEPLPLLFGQERHLEGQARFLGHVAEAADVFGVFHTGPCIGTVVVATSTHEEKRPCDQDNGKAAENPNRQLGEWQESHGS